MTSSIVSAGFRALADELPSLVFCADSSGAAIFCNTRLREYTGMTEAALFGGGWLFAIHQDDREAAELAWRHAIKASEPYEVEYRLRGVDGQYRWFLIRCVPTRSDHQVDQWLGIGVDVNERKLRAVSTEVDLERAEDALATNAARFAVERAELEQRVAARTRELRETNAKLVQELRRGKLLQSAMLKRHELAALGQLSVGLTSDFNNVLAAITGLFELIEKRTKDPGVLKLALGGIEAAKRGADLIRTFTPLARQPTVTPRRVSLARLLDELAPRLLEISPPGVELDIGRTGGVPDVTIDAEQLQSAITNLVANACEAMPDGGRIRITYESIASDAPDKPSTLGDGAAVALHVADTGSGMSAPVMQRAPEPFFTTKPAGDGIGLGLTIVQGLMLHSDGALRIASRVGQGTTVSLYLPVSALPPARANALPELRIHHGGRVLVVEKEVLVRRVIADQLADLGYGIVEAGSIVEAMICVADGAPLAFVTLDSALTSGSGSHLMATMRGVRPNLPVLLTATQSDVLASEADPVLMKPFSADRLSIMVLDMMELAQTRGERDAWLDRLALRFRSPMLARMLARWRSAAPGETLPQARRIRVTRDELDHVAEVAVDQTKVPMTFELVRVGAELMRRAESDFSWWRVDVSGDNAETSQEGAYRRCVTSKRPTYDFSRFKLGVESETFFERLLLPCSEDGAEVSNMLVIVNFDANVKR